MIIRLDVTKKQLGFLIAAMSRHLRTEDVKGLLRNPETTWDFKARVVQEYAQRCELLAMLDRTFNSSREQDDDALLEDK